MDGSKLKYNYQLGKIFEGNDYNWRRGMIGCALSHIQLFINLLDSDFNAFLILEDDIQLVPNFEDKLAHAYYQIKDKEWGIFYLGHHIYEKYITEDTYNKEKLPIAEKWNKVTSFTKSRGGTTGYLISRLGAVKLLEFINKHGMTNGIDTVQQLTADIQEVYYCIPHLIYSECYTGNDSTDTDIQRDFTTLTPKKCVIELNIKGRLKKYNPKTGLYKWDISKAIS